MCCLVSSIFVLTFVGRFDDAEFVSEALYACLNLTGMYYDVILRRKKESTELKNSDLTLSAKSISGTSPFNRFTIHCLKKDSSYAFVSYVLSLIHFSEVVTEMLVQKKFGPDAKYKFIVGIEVLKATLRFYLFSKNGYRILLSSNIPERESEGASSPGESWRGVRAGNPHDSTSADNLVEVLENIQQNDVSQYLSQKALVSFHKSPMDLLNPLSGEPFVGEILFIIRPVIYSTLLYKYSKEKSQSWTPWLVSLAIDVLGRVSGRSLLTKYIKQKRTVIPTFLETEERRRRLWLLLFYLLRSPYYEKLTKQKIKDFCNALGRIPILAIFASIIKEYVPLWEKVYFYTSGS
jgi:peroxin-16